MTMTITIADIGHNRHFRPSGSGERFSSQCTFKFRERKILASFDLFRHEFTHYFGALFTVLNSAAVHQN